MHYLVLDLEMTGLEPGWHKIIQIGAVLYNEQWKELGRYLSNVYPENEDSYSLPALEVHGLTIEELEAAPMMSEALPQFEDWIIRSQGRMPQKMSDRDKADLLRNTLVCGQSVVNDINFLRFAYREEQLKWPFAHTLVDLHTLAFFVFPVLKAAGRKVPQSHSLEAIARFFGYKRAGEVHNALEDAVLTGKCLQQVFALREQMHLPVAG
ncbi:MAG: hypothetical protein OHK0039_09110 [Bacteroidia bacterium]